MAAPLINDGDMVICDCQLPTADCYISGDEAQFRPLVTHHGTSWHTQSSHCHLLYASDRDGMVNLYPVDP